MHVKCDSSEIILGMGVVNAGIHSASDILYKILCLIQLIISIVSTFRGKNERFFYCVYSN